MKIADGPFGPPQVKPEFDACAAAARTHGVPVREVLRAAMAAGASEGARGSRCGAMGRRRRPDRSETLQLALFRATSLCSPLRATPPLGGRPAEGTRATP